MDRQVGDILLQLKEDGLEDNTIVFFYSDHGTGMPRAKRALYNSGIKVPLVIYAPEKYQNLLPYQAGTKTDDIVSFVDFPPTILNLLGISIPEYMQGNPFMGDNTLKRAFAFATSDRVDEAFEISRTVRSKRYSYVRNFLPHLPLIQPNFYTDQSEIMKELLRLKKITKMTPAQQSMWLPKRYPEELYDLEKDPFETNNLIVDPEYTDVLVEMRDELRHWLIKTHDTGLIPEGYLLENCDPITAYELSQSNQFYSSEKVLKACDLLLEDKIDYAQLINYLHDENLLVRYWAANALQYVDTPSEEVIEALSKRLKDPSTYVKLAAAESLCALNHCNSDAQESILAGLRADDRMISLIAARIFELNKDKAMDIIPEVREVHEKLCAESEGKWQGYDLYACWALNEAFK
jgi:hypothetical protein